MHLTKLKKASFSKAIVCLYWIFTFTYWEILAHAGMFEQFQWNFRFALGISWGIALIISLVVGLLPEKLIPPVGLILTVAGTLVYGSQMVYCFIFRTPYSVSQMGLGAGAVTQFWRETLSAMAQNWLWIVSLLVPLVVLIILMATHSLRRPGWGLRGITLLLAAVTALTLWADIRRGGTGMFSDYYFFTSQKSTTSQTMERFGVPMTFILELTRPEDTGSSMSVPVMIPSMDMPAETTPKDTTPKDTTGEADAEETVPEETEPPVTYNVLPLDFEALNAQTEDPKLRALNTYFSQVPATNRNAYTGTLRDYNLIFICAESFSPAAVHPQYTPTLYRLVNEGFVFTNYYTSYPNTTTDGEYILTQGLYPDGTKEKFSSSMISSQKNHLPFALGNLFRTELGVKSWGYHNNVGTYYSRDKTHPNMGYEMKFNQAGMTFTDYWPTSDLEMMMQSVDDYINEPQFHAYYMTFSGHYQYDPNTNGIVRRHYDALGDRTWNSTSQRSYIACHMELDKALEYLLTRLEEAGIADKTAIVLASDHTPYGLPRTHYFDMMGMEADLLTWYKSNLIFWVGDMEEPVVVDEYCCSVDVLPTIMNLWGFSYDSRLFPGTDVFSDGIHTAVLSDHSFLTDKVWFNASTGKVRYLVPEDQIPEGYIESMNQLIASRFEASAEILRNDYFRYLFPQ